ncbi:MAG: peptide ABC transporter substrate-binding protein, partial [Gammaproteobacteria bacterium]
MKLQYLAIFPLVFILGSCGDSIQPVEESLESKILYLGNGTEPKDLDPHTVTGVPESKILMALIEGLVIRHPEGKDPLP